MAMDVDAAPGGPDPPHPNALTTLLFCADPLHPAAPEPLFARETEAAAALGLHQLLIDHDAIDRQQDPRAALRRIRSSVPIDAVYRGWMLRAEDYALLYDALLGRGIRLINAPEAYRSCHWAPLAYPAVSRWSAPAAWLDAERISDDRALQTALAGFGDRPVVVKDWVKSQAAGYWREACYIPSAADLPAVRRIIGRFVELQGKSLVGGLFFRAWQDLARVGGQTEEWRAFSFEGRPIGCWPRFAAPAAERPPPDLVGAVCAALPSRFATADFARLTAGGWLLVEVGDGQVSELPAAADPSAFLSALTKRPTHAD